MNLIWDGVREAFRLVLSLDPMVMSAMVRTLWISCTAVALATAIGLPLGTYLGLATFRGSTLLIMIFRAGMAVPTVFVGLLCYALFSRHGPLGPLELLYSPGAIVLGELLLALPIILAITHGSVKSLDPRVRETALTLGAGMLRRWITTISEARLGVMLAVLTAFARCVSELGIAMMVGGNIKGHTRTLATATALETGKGEFARGLAMGAILLVMALGVMLLIVAVTRVGGSRD